MVSVSGNVFVTFVVHLVKGNAVVDISGRYHCLKHETVAVAGRMGLIRNCRSWLPFTNKPQSGSVTFWVTIRIFFFRLASFFLEVLFFAFF